MSQTRSRHGGLLENQYMIGPHVFSAENFKLETDEKHFLCDGCKMEGFGERFICKLCDRELHKICRYPKASIDHEFFRFSFSFEESPPAFTQGGNYDRSCAEQCNACCKDIRGFSYHCEEEGLFLHPVCSRLERTLVLDYEMYHLTTRHNSACIWCDNNDVSLWKGWSYVSSSERSYVHVHCMSEMMQEHKLMKEREANSDHEQVDPPGYTMNTDPQDRNSETNWFWGAWEKVKQFFKTVAQKI